jgi:hypothetical protein
MYTSPLQQELAERAPADGSLIVDNLADRHRPAKMK